LTLFSSSCSLARSASSSMESISSASERAVKNLFVRLYSGRAARVASVSLGEGTW
jgi:hypothetical protein